MNFRKEWQELARYIDVPDYYTDEHRRVAHPCAVCGEPIYEGDYEWVYVNSPICSDCTNKPLREFLDIISTIRVERARRKDTVWISGGC